MRRQSSPLPAIMNACVLALALSLNCRPASAQVTVTSATPNNAPQGTTALNVSVAGNGFENGAKATWFVSGTTNTGGVTVNSTTFVSSTQLTANITIAENATVGGFDIAVTNTNGRTGVGSDRFTVNPEAVTSTLSSTDATGASFTVQGDGLYLNSSGASTYNNTPMSCSTFDPHGTCIIESLLPDTWYLSLNTNSGRAVHVTLHALGSSPDESVLNGLYSGSAVITRCFDASNKKVSIPLTILQGTSSNHCSLRVVFTANGITYTYAMGPLFAGTGWSTVTCISGSATQSCNTWSITPTPGTALPNPSLANVANLWMSTKKGLVLLGTYELTFHITLTQL